MHFPTSGSWATAMATALLVTTVCGVPVRLSGSATRVERASEIQPRDPRIIPETENYLNDVLKMLTGEDEFATTTAPSPTNGPMMTSTPVKDEQEKPVKPEQDKPVKAEQDKAAKPEQEKPANAQATPSKVESQKPMPSPTTSAETVTFTTTIKSENKPQNIQIGAGWDGKKRIEASDVPVIMNVVYQDIADRFNDFIDSSDEVGLTE